MFITYSLAASPIVQASVAAGGYGPGSDRFGAIVAAVVGLTSVGIGGLARARASRWGGIAGLLIGLTGVILSVVHLANSDGGIGTGNGRAGAMVALVVGLVGMILGGLVLARARQSSSRSSQPTGTTTDQHP